MYELQAYVRQVTHRFSFQDGSGFTTDVDIMAPSSLAGGFTPARAGVA
jgi:hypothetical protein